MADDTSVLVIFEHDLLGEGLVARLEGLDIRACGVKASDKDAVVAALRSHPGVVVIETSDPRCPARIKRLSPNSRVVDATASIGRGYPTQTIPFDAILDALPLKPT